MPHEIAPGSVVGDKGSKPLVFVGNFLGAKPAVKRSLQVGAGSGSLFDPSPELFYPAGASQPVDLLHQPDVRGFSRVRDVAEHGIPQFIAQRLQHTRSQVVTQGLALLIDRRVIAAAEIDPLERALPQRQRAGKRPMVDLAVALNDQGVGGGDRLDVAGINVKDVGQGRSFRGDGDDLVVEVEKPRANAGRIPAHERIAVAQESRENVSPVEVFGCLAEDPNQIDLARGLPGQVLPIQAAQRLRAHGGS